MTDSLQQELLAVRASGELQKAAAQAGVTAGLTAGPYTQAQAATAYNTAIYLATIAVDPASSIDVNGQPVALSSAEGRSAFLAPTPAALSAEQETAIEAAVRAYTEGHDAASTTGAGTPGGDAGAVEAPAAESPESGDPASAGAGTGTPAEPA